eukprot:6930798-Prorocentrum_lima.AAC.1
MFKNKWETLRPDVSVGWSDKYNRLGDLGDGVYAEIHMVSHQDMVSGLKKDGIVVAHAGNQREGPMGVYQDGLLGHV